MILKKWRLKIFNWFAAGSMTLLDTTQEYKSMSSYTIGGNGSGAGNLYYGSLGGGNGNGHNYIYNPQSELSKMNITASSINFNVAKAAGGWIVQVNSVNQNAIAIAGVGTNSELHIIPEGDDFDAALGKIITMSCLKA